MAAIFQSPFIVSVLGYIRIHKDFRQQVRNLFASPVLKDRINNT